MLDWKIIEACESMTATTAMPEKLIIKIINWKSIESIFLAVLFVHCVRSLAPLPLEIIIVERIFISFDLFFAGIFCRPGIFASSGVYD